MSVNPKSKSTATKENALDAQEVDDFLAIRQDGRLGSNRGDGWWHVTPIWYLWEDGRFFHTLGAGRRHLRNFRADEHATLCVDRTPGSPRASTPARGLWSASPRPSSPPTRI